MATAGNSRSRTTGSPRPATSGASSGAAVDTTRPLQPLGAQTKASDAPVEAAAAPHTSSRERRPGSVQSRNSGTQQLELASVHSDDFGMDGTYGEAQSVATSANGDDPAEADTEAEAEATASGLDMLASAMGGSDRCVHGSTVPHWHVCEQGCNLVLTSLLDCAPHVCFQQLRGRRVTGVATE